MDQQRKKRFYRSVLLFIFIYLSDQALRLAEVAKARHKIEETHKNYYALLASSDVGTAGDPLKEKKNPGESMSLMRNEWYAFTATGMYRP